LAIARVMHFRPGNARLDRGAADSRNEIQALGNVRAGVTVGRARAPQEIEPAGRQLLSIPGDSAFILQIVETRHVDRDYPVRSQRVRAGRSACGCNERDSGDQ
jgi:hypothetical protein